MLSAHDGPLWSGPLYRAGRVRALGEFTIEGSAAELALTVERGMRRRGIGTYLVQTGARLLALRRVRRLVAYTLPDNRSFLTLSSRLGGEIRRGLDEVEVVFDIASLHDAYVRRRLAAQVFEAVAPPVSAGPYGQDALREAV